MRSTYIFICPKLLTELHLCIPLRVCVYLLVKYTLLTNLACSIQLFDLDDPTNPANRVQADFIR